ncbi:MAG: PIN domain-containing protein [Flavobacterium sp.]|uniref:PIN domain-containing protein n=1 Tax=Flavobacterium sp. TaxID=239 RepID=UPI0025C34739|nr:PIN domain-containing protein [Flavobacterium sp.]MCA1966899.1 PIN domain-containing protein [Flavobacterium sp.]
MNYSVDYKYVVDTNALISYFSDIFEGCDISVSKESLEIIDQAINNNNEIKLIIPSCVFLEIFIKWFKNEEIANKIISEIYYRIKQKENIEIQPLDKEILENYILIKDIEEEYKFDGHDKQVFASAMTMQCPLISSDLNLIRYNQRKKLVPSILK